MVFGVSVFLSHCLLSVLVGVQIRAGGGRREMGIIVELIHYTFLFYKRPVYKRHEAEIC